MKLFQNLQTFFYDNEHVYEIVVLFFIDTAMRGA